MAPKELNEIYFKLFCSLEINKLFSQFLESEINQKFSFQYLSAISTLNCYEIFFT